MNSFRATRFSLSRMLAAVMFATSLAFIGLTVDAAQARDANASTPAVTETAPSDEDFRVLAKQDGWSVSRNNRAFVVSKQFDDGARFVIIKTKDGYGLGFTDPNWRLREGETFKFSVDIDGKSYSGRGKATSSTTLIATDIRDEFIDDFANGDLVKFEIEGSKWTIVPANVNAVMKAATSS